MQRWQRISRRSTRSDRRAAEQAELYASLREQYSEVAEEREVYAALAEEMENRLVQETARVGASLVAVREEAAERSSDELQARIAFAREAGDDLGLDEADTRRLIDEQLRDAGWEADSRAPHATSAASRPQKGATSPSPSGPPPPARPTTSSSAASRPSPSSRPSARPRTSPAPSSRPSATAATCSVDGGVAAPGGPWGDYRSPSSSPPTAAPTSSSSRPRAASGSSTRAAPPTTPAPSTAGTRPRGCARSSRKDVDAADDAARSGEPTDYLPLRDYQIEAISAVEAAIATGRREVLVAMATGTGKTRTCIGLVYRLIKSKRFRRVLFLVDRTRARRAGRRTPSRTSSSRQLQTFTEIYDVKATRRHHARPRHQSSTSPPCRAWSSASALPGDDDRRRPSITTTASSSTSATAATSSTAR